MARVWIEADPVLKLAIRIFRNAKAAAKHQTKNPTAVVVQLEFAYAVDEIRRQVFCRDGWSCVKCGQMVCWARGRVNSGELDERQARGKTVETAGGNYQSGEISVENCQTLCNRCHTSGPHAKHDRSPSFSTTERLSVKPNVGTDSDGWHYPLEPHIT